MTKVLARMQPGPGRRMLAVALQAALGLALLYAGLVSGPGGALLRALLTLAGAMALWQAQRSWQAGARALELREDGLFDGDGQLLCPLDNIEAIETGVMAFKPTNGLALRLREPMPRGWEPGLWWRYGRRMGLGGATPPHQGKQMAEMLSLLLEKKDPDR